ncbi:MAG: hypothetical protein FJW30_24270 [Acidobacteria bacterium]|nr:hypothetical protein [Acidobacteriota bacterium]
MKLRVTSDSVRLRLKQSEVRTLVQGREVAESCAGLLSYSLVPFDGAQLRATGSNGHITIQVPAGWLPDWDTDTRVGFETSENGFRILIEKDWKCTAPSNPKDNDDCYENPTPVC